HRAHRRHQRRQAGPGGGIGDEPGGHVGEVAGGTDAELQGHGLDGVVGRAVDIAQVVGGGDAAASRGVDVEDHVRRVGGAGALEGDGRVGDAVELGDAAIGQGVRIGLVGDDVEV